MQIAIATPATDIYSETFIRQHIARLRGTVQVFSGRPLPDKLGGQSIIANATLARKLLFRVSYRLGIYQCEFQEFQLKRVLKRSNIQVLLAEYGTLGANVFPVCKRIGIPVVVHFHGYDAYIPKTLEQFAARYKVMFSGCYAVIAVSNDMVTQLQSLGCPAEKIIYNPYGPDPAFFDVAPTEGSKQVLAIGRFVDKKAPDLLLHAFALVTKEEPDARLVMGGDGLLREVCQRLAVQLGIADKVRFAGILSPEQVREEMDRSLFFSQHSIRPENGDSEGTPVAVLEAGAASLPVVATRHAGIADVVVHGETGLLVAEKDVAGMAANMLDLLRNPGKARLLGLAARQRIREHFSLEQHISKLNEVLQSAVLESRQNH